MNINEAKTILETNGYLVENKNDIIRYHMVERKYLADVLKNGLVIVNSNRGKNTSDYKSMKPGIWLSGSRDFIPVFRTLDDNEKILLKITMPIDFYMSHEREYWPNGRTEKSVTVKPGEAPMNSREGRTYVEKFNGNIPSEYITVESDIGLNRKGDRRTVEYYRYIVDEILGVDSDDYTDKEIESLLRNMNIEQRRNANEIEGIDIIEWKPGNLPIIK